MPADDKKTQIGTGQGVVQASVTGEPSSGAQQQRIRPPTSPQQKVVTGPPQNVDPSGGAKTEFLDPSSVPPANAINASPTPAPVGPRGGNTPAPASGYTPPPQAGGLPPPQTGIGPAMTAGYIAQLQAQSNHDAMLGQTISGRYYVQKKLGEGGMGSVYLATHTILEKQVALKVLHGEFARKPDLVERFMQEAKAASRIRHENVIDVSDFGMTPDGLVFFAMELLKGHDLHDEVARARIAGQLLPWSRTKRIFLQICAALSVAHSLGIVHRDLKPENVFLVDFLGDPDFVKLLDFGIAKLTEVGEDGRKLTRTGMLFGTPEYMSPEQARGEQADLRVDVYAMGCILFQLITTRVPFEADNFMGVLSLHLTEPPPSIPDEVFDRIGAPRALAQVIDKALEKNRDHRWSSIDELANAVRIACGEPPLSKTTEVRRAENMAAPANVTTQRPAVTPPPTGIASGTAPPPPGTYPPPPGSTPPGSMPPGSVPPGMAATPATALKTQWTGQLVVPDGPADARPATGKSKAPMLIGVAIVVAGGAIAAALVLKGGGGSTGTTNGSGSNAVALGSGSGSSMPTTAPVDAAPQPPALPAEVVVTLDSTPKGAEVYDFDKKALVGTTPATFHVTPGHELRHFTVKMRGYTEELVELVPEQAEIKPPLVTLKRGTGTVTVQTLPKVVDAGVPLQAIDAAAAAPPDAAVVVPAAVDAAIKKNPDDDCPEIPCLKAMPDAGAPANVPTTTPP
nr:serine/threonine-protein kinase [Kofleriaceae bacterium]